jgi:hypothetical protein
METRQGRARKSRSGSFGGAKMFPAKRKKTLPQWVFLRANGYLVFK